jgi:hypothetical protein
MKLDTERYDPLSHHFDTPTAREDPRLNLCDMYLFAGSPTTTVMAITVNPAATAQTVAPFRDEAIYAIQLDLDNNGRPDISFKVRFTDHAGSQRYDVIRSSTEHYGLNGDVIANGLLNDMSDPESGVRTFSGVVRDPFAGDAQALEQFKAAFADGRYEPQAFDNHVNFFHDRTVAAIVLEVPNQLIGNDIQIHAWSTVSLFGHAPEQQVARWGLPLFTHIFLPDAELRERFNRTSPFEESAAFLTAAASTVSSYTQIAGTTPEPDVYGNRVASMFGSLTLPYRVGSTASFDYTGFNGRALGDNVMDTMLTLLTNSPLGTGIAPDPQFLAHDFPFLQPASSNSFRQAPST